MKDLLIIDEITAVKIELKNELKDYNINIISVKTELEAVSILYENEKIDILLWAINSSNLMQFDRIKEITRKNIFKRVAVVVISKYADKRHFIKAIESGAKEFIVRPFDKNTLIKKLSKFIRLEKKLDRNIKILDEGEKISYSIVELLNKEIKAASRGEYKLSLIMLTLTKKSEDVEPEYLEKEIIEVYIKLLRSKLRETDIVMKFQNNYILLILPFTDLNGVQSVKGKSDKIFDKHSTLIKMKNGYKIIKHNVTYPNEGKTKDLLIETLEKKMKNIKIKRF